MNSANAVEKVLESVLNSYQLRVEIVSDARYCGSWYEAEPATRHGQFHLIADGSCLVTGPSFKQPVHLQGGDLVIFPHGASHSLTASTPGGTRPTPAEAEHCGYTSMLCGELEFVMGERNPILRALPDCLVLHAQDGGEVFRHLAHLLLLCARAPRAGQRIVADKLADALFTMAVCEYAFHGRNPVGIFAALGDPRLARALEAIHERPGEDWTLHALAGVAGMSRSAFALSFTEIMGQPPMQYLTLWRVAQARRLLQDRRLSVASIAERLGYKSETAFRKLFKRIEGVGPGKARSTADA